MPIPSHKLTEADAEIIRALLAEGWLQSDVASLLGVNIGRISEIASGARFPGVPAAVLSSDAARARLAGIQIAWVLRISRQLNQVITRPRGAMI
jgi:transcriptional regulator with XRE-family HTH domain